MGLWVDESIYAISTAKLSIFVPILDHYSFILDSCKPGWSGNNISIANLPSLLDWSRQEMSDMNRFGDRWIHVGNIYSNNVNIHPCCGPFSFALGSCKPGQSSNIIRRTNRYNLVDCNRQKMGERKGLECWWINVLLSSTTISIFLHDVDHFSFILDNCKPKWTWNNIRRTYLYGLVSQTRQEGSEKNVLGADESIKTISWVMISIFIHVVEHFSFVLDGCKLG